MSPFAPDPNFQFPPMTAEEVHQAYGMSKSMLDQVCSIIGVNRDDPAAYGVAAITFHQELFDVLQRADVHVPTTHRMFPAPIAREPDEVDWHPIHQRMQDTGMEVLGLSLFDKIHRIRQLEQGTAPAGATKPTDTSIGLLITEAVSFGGFVGFDVPSLPTLRTLPKGGAHEGHATERDGAGRTGEKS